MTQATISKHVNPRKLRARARDAAERAVSNERIENIETVKHFERLQSVECKCAGKRRIALCSTNESRRPAKAKILSRGAESAC